MRVEYCRKKPSYHVKRELPKQKNCEGTNGVITQMYWNFNDLWDNKLT